VKVIDSIRRVVAEDAAHGGTTHELYLRRETVALITGQRGGVKSVEGLPLHVQNVGRDCIATLRGGKIISVTNL
jgi:hypothetical protein